MSQDSKRALQGFQRLRVGYTEKIGWNLSLLRQMGGIRCFVVGKASDVS